MRQRVGQSTEREPCRRLVRAVGSLARFGLGVALAGLAGGCPSPSFSDTDRRAVQDVLIAQREAWNAGDVEAFMDGYIPSPALVFTSGGSVRRGYDEARARYQAKYVDGGKMGMLAFTELEVTGLGPDAALVMGRWALRGTEEAGNGIFSLVLVRRAEGWKILHDHTSASPPTPADPTTHDIRPQ